MTARAGPALARARSTLSKLPGPLWLAALALLLYVVYGRGYAHYDAVYGLIWGRDIADGGAPPDMSAPHSPTPHPLVHLVSLALAPFDQLTALTALEWLSLLSFAALGWTAFLLGSRAASPLVGVLFAAILLTRPVLLRQALMASIDIPFLALVLGAAAIELRRSRAGLPVLVLLGLAGLLRPEAWLLAGLYWLWLLPGLDARRRVMLAAVVAAAPLIWALSDYLLAGDALHSLTNTSDQATRIGRPQGPITAIEKAPRYLNAILHPAVLAGAAAGLALAVARFRRELAVPLALLAAGGATWLAQGLADLPLLDRYLFVPGLMLALLCAWACLGWQDEQPGRLRSLWIAGALLLGLGLTAQLVRDRSDLATLSGESSFLSRADEDLDALMRDPDVAALDRSCRRIQLDYFRSRPLYAYLSDRRPETLLSGRAARASDGLLIGAGRDNRREIPYYRGRSQRPPASFHEVARNRSWVAYANCRDVPLTEAEGGYVGS